MRQAFKDKESLKHLLTTEQMGLLSLFFKERGRVSEASRVMLWQSKGSSPLGVKIMTESLKWRGKYKPEEM